MTNIALSFIALILCFIAYVIAISAVKHADGEHKKLLETYLKGMQYTLRVSGFLLAVTFPIVTIWIVIQLLDGLPL